MPPSAFLPSAVQAHPSAVQTQKLAQTKMAYTMIPLEQSTQTSCHAASQIVLSMQMRAARAKKEDYLPLTKRLATGIHPLQTAWRQPEKQLDSKSVQL